MSRPENELLAGCLSTAERSRARGRDDAGPAPVRGIHREAGRVFHQPQPGHQRTRLVTRAIHINVWHAEDSAEIGFNHDRIEDHASIYDQIGLKPNDWARTTRLPTTEGAGRLCA